jgi:hypothetical protein
MRVAKRGVAKDGFFTLFDSVFIHLADGGMTFRLLLRWEKLASRMSQITVEIPDKLMSQLSLRAGELRQTPEAFVSSCIMAALQTDEHLTPSAVASQEAFEDLLEARDNGPWRALPEDLVERVMSRVLVKPSTSPSRG